LTQLEKQSKLAKLDELLLDRMIEIMEGGGDVSELRDLSTPMNMLKSNQVVAEKPKDSSDDYMKKKVAEAKKRRARDDS